MKTQLELIIKRISGNSVGPKAVGDLIKLLPIIMAVAHPASGPFTFIIPATVLSEMSSRLS